MSDTINNNQCLVIDYLSTPKSFGEGIDVVQKIETHGGIVFLAGKRAYKIKRAVKFPYMDFSTLEKRQKVLARELELNRRTAPDLYLDMIPLYLMDDGDLCLGCLDKLHSHEQSHIIEWVLVMRRFEVNQTFDHIARQGELDDQLARHTAIKLVDYHRQCPVLPGLPGAKIIETVISDLISGLKGYNFVQKDFPRSDQLIRDIELQLLDQLDQHHELLNLRGEQGLIRRCHGDLHLANIVLWQDEPTFFDCLEFDENLASIDVFYDLSFLLMDCAHFDQNRAGNLVYNHYLFAAHETLHYKSLGIMPLLLSLRALVRARVAADRLAQLSATISPELEELGSDKGRGRAEEREEKAEVFQSYLDLAAQFLSQQPGQLFAIGGFSGTGKSTLAATLAPTISAFPGAVHLRTDLIRKQMFDVDEYTELESEHYTKAVSENVYAHLFDLARICLESGSTAIMDGVFSNPEERQKAAQIAAKAGASFQGFWLEAGAGVLSKRIEARRHDASDATVSVMEEQLARGAGEVTWTKLDAALSISQLAKKVLAQTGSDLVIAS